MNAKELYIELQRPIYDNRPYDRIKDMGEGMEDNDESVLYGFIDKKAHVVIPFQALTWKEMEQLRPEAERRAKD